MHTRVVLIIDQHVYILGGNYLPRFIPGLKLSELFYKEVVGPILKCEFPNLEYSAGLIGSGSEVLGYDTQQSTDHHWGPRMLLFLSENDYKRDRDKIWTVLSEKLPYKFRGYSTNLGKPDRFGVRLLQNIKSGPVNHLIEIFTVKSFFKELLNFNPYREIKTTDWLGFSEHRLREMTKGMIFHDDLNLDKIRKKLNYYPRDIWLHFLSLQWYRISQEEAFMGRCGDVGDELGSKIIASRLVEHLMKLCFLMEKEFAPYSKWFGTAFAKLGSSKKLIPIFNEVLAAQSWKEREKYLCQAYTEVAILHNKLGITKPLETEVSKFYNRPYLIIHARNFSDEIRKSIVDEELKNWPGTGLVD